MIWAACLVLISFYEIQLSELVYFLSQTKQLQHANIYSQTESGLLSQLVSLPTVSPSEPSLLVSIKPLQLYFSSC